MLRALTLAVAAVAASLVLTACPSVAPEQAPRWGYEPVASLPSPVRAVGRLASGALLAATSDGLYRSGPAGDTWTPVGADGLPEGDVVFVGGSEVGPDLVFVWGAGLYSTADNGGTFERVPAPPPLPLPSLLNPWAEVVPFATASDSLGRTWLAGVGGLFVSDDGLDWSTVPVGASGSLNVLFTGVAVRGDDVWAVAQLADSMLPSSFAGLLSGTVFHSPDQGETWEDVSEGFPASAPMAVSVGLDEIPCVGTMDRGVWCREGTWTQAGGDFDAVDVRSDERGLFAATASRGVWIWQPQEQHWTRFGVGAMAGIAEAVAVQSDGAVLGEIFEPREEVPPEADADGTVHVALSFHANYYHSYRGDTPDDDGYGQDIDVIRTILGWLEEHPEARADWDIENHFTLDGWMATESPDVLAAIAARVASGSDDVRVMSWNNGAVAGQTREEFDASIARALASYEAAFAEVTSGVQPQENMFDPDHIGWYAEHGIDWITLFYSSNGFTGMRLEADLTPADRYGTVRIRDPESLSDTMTWVPVYHHADVLDHGGLAAWVRQISATVPGDSLLAIHFDADAESWENFGVELDTLQPLVDAGTAVFTNLEPYVDAHPPATTVDVAGDLADGTGDGFGSWAEKDLNHEVWTKIVRARHLADAARILGDGDDGVEALLAAALEPRLIALSTTHFGLAAPFLHPDRVASATAAADAAVTTAGAALDAAIALAPPGPTEITLLNITDAAGPALVEIPLSLSAEDWVGPEGIHVMRGGTPVPVQVEVLVIGGPEVGVVLRAVLDFEPFGSHHLTWQYDPSEPPASGGLTTADVPASVPLRTPFVECAGVAATAPLEPLEIHVDAAGMVVSEVEYAALPVCDAEGSVAVTRQRWAGLAGTVLSVVGQLPEVSDPTDLESVALSPIGCDGPAATLAWDSLGGTQRTRPMRPGGDTWNANAARSYVVLGCADGSTVEVAHRTTDRTSIAFAPIRERGGDAVLAPLGTLWGVGPWHDGRSVGGSGLGEIATMLVGSQFRPAAPDWAGKTVTYRLLVGSDLGHDALVLFAHPPVAVVGQ